MPVRKRKDRGRFVVTIERGKHPDTGKRIRDQRSFAREKDAKTWRDTEEARMAASLRPSSEVPTVGALLASWLAHGEMVKHWSPTHLRRSRWIVEHDLAPLHAVRLERLSVEHVEDLLAGLLAGGAATNSVRLVRAALSAALNLAVRRRLLPPGHNVAGLAQMPPVKREPPMFLDPPKAQRFLDAITGDELEAFYATAVLLALRPSEAIGLRWRDVDLREGSVSIERTVQYVGKYHEREMTKTDAGRREIAMPRRLTALLRLHRRKMLSRGFYRPEAPVFPNRRGAWLHEPYLNRRLATILEDAGLPKVTLYQLRHTGATLMMALGAPEAQVQESMGHTTPMMTRRYAQVTEPMKREVASLLDAFARGGGSGGN